VNTGLTGANLNINAREREGAVGLLTAWMPVKNEQEKDERTPLGTQALGERMDGRATWASPASPSSDRPGQSLLR
jgi:hypothetical protein